MGCLEGDRPSEEQVRQLRELVQNAPEPAVQPYLEDCVCAFAAGAYGSAIVVIWCAIARYLRLVIEAIGMDVARLYYKQEEAQARQPFSELIKRSDKLLYIVYKRMRLVEDRLTENVERLADLWTKRCLYAHPTDEKATLSDVLAYMNEARWLLTRRVEQERFQDFTLVLQCAIDNQFSLTPERAHELVWRVREDQRESLAIHLLNTMLAEETEAEETEKDIPSERGLTLWKALRPMLSHESRGRLMKQLAASLSPVPVQTRDGNVVELPRELDRLVDVADVARYLVFWPEAYDYAPIWEYLVTRRGDLSARLKKQVRQFAPSPYREQIDEPPEFEED